MHLLVDVIHQPVSVDVSHLVVCVCACVDETQHKTVHLPHSSFLKEHKHTLMHFLLKARKKLINPASPLTFPAPL